MSEENEMTAEIPEHLRHIKFQAMALLVEYIQWKNNIRTK